MAHPDQMKALTCAWPGGKSDRGYKGSELPTPKPVPLRSNTGTRRQTPSLLPTSVPFPLVPNTMRHNIRILVVTIIILCLINCTADSLLQITTRKLH
ncbi:hypothetical protein TSMEX_002725 [Taenia solium]|eukprot:TsM_001094000 transcript=TsM_001094000 gene=TsM_001094000